MLLHSGTTPANRRHAKGQRCSSTPFRGSADLLTHKETNTTRWGRQFFLPLPVAPKPRCATFSVFVVDGSHRLRSYSYEPSHLRRSVPDIGPGADCAAVMRKPDRAE